MTRSTDTDAEPLFWRVGRRVYGRQNHSDETTRRSSVWSAVWEADFAAKKRQQLTDGMLQTCRQQAYFWIIFTSLMVGARLFWLKDVDLGSTYVMTSTSLAVIVGIMLALVWLQRACDRYAKTDHGMILEAGHLRMPVELLRQAQLDSQRSEVPRKRPSTAPFPGAGSDAAVFAAKEKQLTRALLNWWEEQLTRLDDDERHTAAALLSEFEGSAGDLLEVARRV